MKVGFPTLADVARRAHVSPSTASKVMREAEGVSPHLRDLVRQAAAELDYRPSADGRALKAGGLPGHVTLAVPTLAGAYYRRLTSLLLRATHEQGLPTAVVETGGDPATERRLLTDRPPAEGGLLLTLTGQPPAEPVPTDGVPTVLIVDLEGPASLDVVSVDSAGGTAACTTHLLATGRRHLALLGAQGAVDHAAARQRERGFLAAVTAHPGPVRTELRALAGWDSAHGELAVAHLLDGAPDVDAVVAANDETAFGVVRGLRRLGRRVPQDVAVTGFDDVDAAAHGSPPLTTVALPADEMARRAVDLLMRRLRGEQGPPRAVTVPGRLVVREST